MTTMKCCRQLAAVATGLLVAASCYAAATPEEAAQLKTALTPLGAERASNKDGTIPAWTGGLGTSSTPLVGGRQVDPYAGDKPLYSITAKNVNDHSAKLSDGVKAMFKKYPETFRIDVYPTRRSASAPQKVYDNTLRNATKASMNSDQIVQGAYGGIPFPIPKNGAEVMWNSLLNWHGEAWQSQLQAYLGTADGKLVMSVDAKANYQSSYYYLDQTPEKFNGEYFLTRIINNGPPIRAGEAILGRVNVDNDKSLTWVYMTGQRRVRRLPVSCCDTPTPASAGVMSFDEISVYSGRLDRFSWKILGKKEMLVPYNSNRVLLPKKASEVLTAHHLNPDHIRWELHRVWEVEATLAPGARHTAPRSVYYIDEDSWMALLGDRYDAKGQLWKMLFQLPLAAPDLPGLIGGPYGYHDMLSGTWFVAQIWNEKSVQYRLQPRLSDSTFTPDALAGEGVR